MENKKKRNLIGCGVVTLALIIIGAIAGTCFTGTEELTLSARVSFDGEQFTITNQDSFDWQQVTFYLNSDYELYAPVIEANTTYTVGAMQFTKRDGTMFNPFTMKPLHMSVAGKNSEGVQGWWHGGW